MTTRPVEVLSDAEFARLVRVVDGDTVTAIRQTLVGHDDAVEVLTRDRFPRRLRLVVIDTPEEGEPLYETAGENVAAWIAAHPNLRVRSYKPDGFGRVLADVYDPFSGDTLSGHLLSLGYPLYGGR